MTSDPSPKPNDWIDMSIDLKLVDPGSLRVAQDPDHPGTELKYSGWNLHYSVKGQEAWLELGDNGQELGTHLANAFARAAQLCGAKASPF